MKELFRVGSPYGHYACRDYERSDRGRMVLSRKEEAHAKETTTRDQATGKGRGVGQAEAGRFNSQTEGEASQASASALILDLDLEVIIEEREENRTWVV